MLNEQHFIVYDPKDQARFLQLLEYYVTHEDEARHIAQTGEMYVRAHHMAVNRIDYVLMHLYASEQEKERNPHYWRLKHEPARTAKGWWE